MRYLRCYILKVNGRSLEMLAFSRSFKLRDYRHFDADNRQVLLHEDADCDRLLEEFYSSVVAAIREKKNFPVIRLADGEFQFLLGKNELNLRKPLFLIKTNSGFLKFNFYWGKTN